MKKLLLIVYFFALTLIGNAQGLEKIVVEKYYISDATDAANSQGTLPEGSVTYRIYVDMLPDYTFKLAYGSSIQPLRMVTTTQFFNHEVEGLSIPTFTTLKAKKNTVMLDSWITNGGTCSGYLGIPKWEDDGLANFVNSNNPKLLQNNNSKAGYPLKERDGMWAGTVEPCKTIGIDVEMMMLGTNDTDDDGIPDVQKDFIINSEIGGGWGPLNRIGGVTSSNRVLIAQVTTDGIFEYEFNIQLATPAWTKETFSPNPINADFSGKQYKLKGIINPSQPPMVAITAPTSGSSFGQGNEILISANAYDATIDKVEFFIDDISQGSISSGLNEIKWIASVAGNHTIKAIATDYEGIITASDPVTITVIENKPPVISISSPVEGAKIITDDMVVISTNASDPDGSVSMVEFFVDDVSVGNDNSAPFQTNWTASAKGIHKIKVKATDDKGTLAESSIINVQVNDNVYPNLSITNPLANTQILKNTSITLKADASDEDGSISKVQFLIDDVLKAEDNSSPYEYNWLVGDVLGNRTITVKAYDNRGSFREVSVSVKIVEGNIAPTVSLLNPQNGSIFKSGEEIIIDVEATDADGTVSSVEAFVDGLSVGVDNTLPYSFRYTNNVLGSHTLSVKAKDDKNAENTSEVITIDIVNNLPVVELTSPAVDDVIALNSDIVLSANATDIGGSIVSVDFYIDDVKVGTDELSPFSLNYKASAPGVHLVKALAKDNDDGFAMTAPVSIIINTPPTISLTSPLNNSNYKIGELVRITAEVSDPDENSSISQVEFFVDGNSIGVDNAAPFSLDYVGVANIHIISAKATDNRGSITTSSTINISEGDNIPPSIFITTPAAGDVNLNRAGDPVTITASASDNDGSIVKVIFYVDGNSIDTVKVAPYTTNKYLAQNKLHEIKAKAVDNNGGETISSSVNINIILSGIMETIKNDYGKMKLYPNPAIDMLNLTFEAKNTARKAIYMIMDLSGKVLKTESIKIIKGFNHITVELSLLPEGQYIINLYIDENLVKTNKFFKL